MKPLKRLCVIVLFVPVCVVSPFIAMVQYVMFGYCPGIAPWTWLIEWAERDISAQEPSKEK